MLAAVYARVYTWPEPVERGSPVQLTYDEPELLASHPYEEPLIAGGVRCHGGFDADGTYVSPRTLHRTPAIEAWQANHRSTFGTDLMGVPLDTWPGHYPNVAQARFLIESGVPEPIICNADPDRHRRGLRRHDPPLPHPRPQAHLRRGHRRHRPRPPRRRSVRGPRPRRGRAGSPRMARARAATSRCGSRPGTSPSGTRPPRTTPSSCSQRMGIGQMAKASTQPPLARRRQHRPRDAGRAHGPPAAHRDLRLPHLRLGRGAARRPRPGRRRRRGRPPRQLHPRRRDPARRVPEDRPHRDAGPHDRGRDGRSTPAPTWSAPSGTGPWRSRSAPGGRRRSTSSGARSSTRCPADPTPPTSWPASTTWPTPHRGDPA